MLDNDPGGISPASVEVVDPPSFGIATPDGQGAILYHNHLGTPTTHQFTYRASNGGGTSAPVAVTLHLSGSLRIPNPNLNVPAAPPVTSVALSSRFRRSGDSWSPLCRRIPWVVHAPHAGPSSDLPSLHEPAQLPSAHLRFPIER